MMNSSDAERHKNLERLPLSMQESVLVAIKTALQLVPFGIGSAIVEGYFGTIDERRQKRVEAFVKAFGTDIAELEARVRSLDERIFTSDEFAQLFETVFRRVLVESQREKLRALRGALVSIVVDHPRISFDKKNHFLKAIDALEALHIQVLRVLASLATQPEDRRFLSVAELCKRLDVRDEADVNFLYSVLDTLANREFIQSGPIPFRRDQTIEKPKQTFRATALGLQFLEFVRMAA